MSERHTGIVAFLFTDIEGSTRLWEEDQGAMSAALSQHDAILHRVIAQGGGEVFKTAGDAFCAVFPSATAAISAAVAGQRTLASETWPASTPLHVRMAIHAGHAESRDGDYFGPSLNRVARLLATAHGDQIVVSRAASDLLTGNLPAELTLRDLGEYELRGLHLPERIFQVLAPGIPDTFAPLHTPERLLRNVPRPSTPLLGREEAVRQVRERFGLQGGGAGAPTGVLAREPARLLTLTGPGGTGKTRLSLHLARELGIELPDGAVFVSLASITDPTLVPAAIASALDLAEGGSESTHDLVLDHLRDRRMLLVLDNLEQVMSASELIADLAFRCPRLLILVTSRERLNVRGEVEIPLPPLALPAQNATPAGARRPLTVEEVCQSPAVQLFVARAKSVKPDFAVTEESADQIAEICARLDGLPLAIELAAARAKLLTPQALLARFDNRLDLLNRGSRDLPDRQKTMRDTIAWSYDLLSPAEQRLFASLAVFVGGATIEAVEEVAAEDLNSAGVGEDVVELLESLTDKSLVRLVDDGDETRLAMFETIRDFARERLTESRALGEVARRHAGFFLTLAEAAESRLAGREQASWLARLDRDQANLRASIAWYRTEEECERALRLGSALWRFWWLRGDLGDGRALLLDLLHEGLDCDQALRAKALNGAGVLSESHGELELAARLHDESLEISRGLGDLQGTAWALNNLGVVEISRGNFDCAGAYLTESLAVAEELNDQATVATVLIDLEQIAHQQGDPERSVSLLTRALSLFRTLGDESQVARALNNLAMVSFERGELARAQELLSESLSLHRGVGDRQGIASTLNNLAEVLTALGEFDEAVGLLLESQLLAMETGNRLYAAIASENLANLTQKRGEGRGAATQYREALLLYRAVADQQGILSCLAGLALVAADEGDAQQATALLGTVSALRDANESLELPDIAALLLSLRSTLGDAQFDAAWQAGAALPGDMVIEQVAVKALPLPLPATV